MDYILDGHNVIEGEWVDGHFEPEEGNLEDQMYADEIIRKLKEENKKNIELILLGTKKIKNGATTWFAMTSDKRPIIENSFIAFKEKLANNGVVIPTKKDVLGMKCDGHYYSTGGWTKIFNRHIFASDDVYADFLLAL